MPERLRRRIENEQAVVAVEQDFAAALELLAGVVQSDDGGNVQRARHDRGVRSAAPQIGREAKNILAVPCRPVLGGGVLAGKNVRVRWPPANTSALFPARC